MVEHRQPQKREGLKKSTIDDPPKYDSETILCSFGMTNYIPEGGHHNKELEARRNSVQIELC